MIFLSFPSEKSHQTLRWDSILFSFVPLARVGALLLRPSVLGQQRAYIRDFFDADKKYEFLRQRDVIAVANSATRDSKELYIEITHTETFRASEYFANLEFSDHDRQQFERRLGHTVTPDAVLTIFEFKRVYDWQLVQRSDEN